MSPRKESVVKFKAWGLQAPDGSLYKEVWRLRADAKFWRCYYGAVNRVRRVEVTVRVIPKKERA